MSTYYLPYRTSSNNIKMVLDLTNYATKNDLKNITHVHVSTYASKTNLAALKSEVDKIYVDKLKTTPPDLAKLSNVVKNDVVKKTDYNAKVTSIESQIAGVTKNTLDNLGDITKLKAVYTNSFVLKTKLASDATTLENKIDTVDKKIPDISGLATKTSLTSYLQTSTFNSKVTEVENKTKPADIITKSTNTKANTIKSDLTVYAKKSDVATDITTIKNDYVTNASLTSKLSDLKSQHIATEGTPIDNKTKNNASDILKLKNKLQQKEDTINENERGNSFARGFFSYIQNSNLVYECKVNSMKFDISGISEWKPKDIYDSLNKNVLNSVRNTKTVSPNIKRNINGLLYFSFNGNYFKQDPITILNNIINIYVVYKLDPISSTRNTDHTIQNALFGAMKITKNTDYSKNNYTGYGLCFDEGGEFSHTVREGNFNRVTNAKNVIIFVVHTSSSIHATNRANKVYVMGREFIQGINGTTIYAEKLFHNNFTEFGVKFVLNLHYNGNNSYLFVNGRQELKFKAKDDQMINEKLCLGNLSDQWTTNESEKTGVYGNIYDFVVYYKAINGVQPIYDMHRYLMIKYYISP